MSDESQSQPQGPPPSGPHSLSNDALRQWYDRVGFGGRVGFGERPALLVIDLAKGWTDPASPAGSDLATVLTSTRQLLDVAREAHVPIFFTVMSYDQSLSEAGAVLLSKTRQLRELVRGSRWVEIEPA